MFMLIEKIMKMVAITGLALVLNNHIHLQPWEMLAFSFGVAMLLG